SRVVHPLGLQIIDADVATRAATVIQRERHEKDPRPIDDTRIMILQNERENAEQRVEEARTKILELGKSIVNLEKRLKALEAARDEAVRLRRRGEVQEAERHLETITDLLADERKFLDRMKKGLAGHERFLKEWHERYDRELAQGRRSLV